jgi:MFS family permease
MARLGTTDPGEGTPPQTSDDTRSIPGNADQEVAKQHGVSKRTTAAVSRTLESLKYRGFRYMWLGSLLGMGGFGMQSIARTVLVDDLTGSAFITSLVAMGFAPTMLVMSLFGGVAGDRMDRRLVIQVSQGAAAALALVVAILIFTGAVHWVHLLIASMLQGVTFAFQMPARQALVPHLVGKKNVTNALALNSAGMGIMTIVGPAIAMILYGKLGPEAVYFTVAGMSVFAVLFTSLVPSFKPESNGKKTNVFTDIAEGIKYTYKNRLVFMLIISSVISALFAMPFRMQLPVFARRLYDIDASEIGWMMAAMGVGGLLAAGIAANLRPGNRRGIILVVIGIGGSGVGMILLAFSHFYLVGLAVMVAVGLVGSIRMTLGQSLSIEATDDAFRARVMSLNMMSFGLMPLGALPMGYSVDKLGAETTLVILGVTLLIATTLLMVTSSTLRNHS